MKVEYLWGRHASLYLVLFPKQFQGRTEINLDSTIFYSLSLRDIILMSSYIVNIK